MRTTSIEVKTIYEIRFDFGDFAKIFTAAKDDVTRINAFENFDLEDTTMGNLCKCYESLGKINFFLSHEEAKQQTENIQYIVRKLGFDGVVRYGGFYDKDKEKTDGVGSYHMSVYNHGADI